MQTKFLTRSCLIISALKMMYLFWRAWRKRYCSSSVKSVNTNGKHGDDEICAEFTEQFQSVFRPNTVNTDAKYELEQQDLWRLTANYEDAFL